MLKPGAALLFDIDGTLADTDVFHIEATNRVFGRFGHVFDRARYNAEIQGFTMDDITRRLLPGESTARRHELMAEKEVIFRDLARSEIEPVAGLMDLLDRANALGIPLVAVTNAPRLNAEMILGGLGISHRFRTVISGEELPEGKPHPMPYIEGLKVLNANAAHALAFEDSRSGIRSATAAGIATIGITTGLTHDEVVGAGAVGSASDYSSHVISDWMRQRLGVQR